MVHKAPAGSLSKNRCSDFLKHRQGMVSDLISEVSSFRLNISSGVDWGWAIKNFRLNTDSVFEAFLQNGICHESKNMSFIFDAILAHSEIQLNAIIESDIKMLYPSKKTSLYTLIFSFLCWLSRFYLMRLRWFCLYSNALLRKLFRKYFTSIVCVRI